MSKKITAHRSAVNGRFVTEKFADKHPDKTVKETIKVSKPAPKKGK
ncbi:MAG: hypothetical protein U1D41_02545 [Nitrosomonas sp.]|jgi:hypothetical protein|nr:hypothetical protein [Nitrosomonas sp.]MDZ4105037.1 hypothetical protein [Nitrosomonas sp.]